MSNVISAEQFALVLDTLAKAIAETPLTAKSRDALVHVAISHISEEQAQRFLDMAYEQGEFAPGE